MDVARRTCRRLISDTKGRLPIEAQQDQIETLRAENAQLRSQLGVLQEQVAAIAAQ